MMIRYNSYTDQFVDYGNIPNAVYSNKTTPDYELWQSWRSRVQSRQCTYTTTPITIIININNKKI